MAAAKNCRRKGSTPAWREFMARKNKLVITNGPRGKIAPLSRHTHNMKEGPLNVMEVIWITRSQYEWWVSSNKTKVAL